ncbi:MAG: SDR family NAD(P)-dependent oxidoreductase, partial [Pseudomonadota bacterium]
TTSGLATALSELLEKDRPVDLLVNAAGIGISGPALEVPQPATSELLDLNARAVMHLTRALVPAMQARRFGGVLTISSFGGAVPGPYQADYYASKAHLNSWMEALAWEVRKTGTAPTTSPRSCACTAVA